MEILTKRYLRDVVLSVGGALFVLGLLLHYVSAAAEPQLLPRLMRVLREVGPFFVVGYMLTNIGQALFRSVRYRLILATTADEVPSLWHLFLVSMVRNMFVDMLPARLGELSFIAMLNKGFKVGADSCIVALSLSFVFDFIALLFLLLILVGYQAVTSSLQAWLVVSVFVLVVVCVCILVFIFVFFVRVGALFEHWSRRQRSVMKKVGRLAGDTARALQAARDGAITMRLLAWSLAVRFCKYLGLYLLFLAVVHTGFTDISTAVGDVLVALISGEASASLPVPAFMSFGTYEAGGALALIVLGASRASSVLIMLAVHIWSQIIDYSLGIIGLSAFFFSITRWQQRRKTASPHLEKRLIPWVLTSLVLLLGLGFFAMQMRGLKKMGSFTPPKAGVAVVDAPERRIESQLSDMEGFVIWSSNRFGNHDLLLLSLPDLQLRHLTSHPHSEYYPRISPDGCRVAFARAHEPYVSQRNQLAWDVHMLDLITGQEQLIAKNGNFPTWSEDGEKIFFQRGQRQIVEYLLAKRRERLLLGEDGNSEIPSSVYLQTPSWSDERQLLAATLRGGRRGTYILEPKGPGRQVGGGCQLTWSPDDSFLYYVDHGGRMQNAFYRVDAATLQKQLWFDFPGAFSHEYFPKMANQGEVMVYGASSGGHEHDRADYEIFLWKIGSPAESAVRLTYHTGNDSWPDIYLKQ